MEQSRAQQRFVQANQLRNQGQFGPALQIYSELGKALSYPAAILHNAAICLFGLGQAERALAFCKAAQKKEPGLAHAYMLEVRIQRKLDPMGIEAERCLGHLLKRPNLEAELMGQTRLELAELQLNVFCDAKSSAQTLLPILNDTPVAERARLSYLVSKFYDRTESDQELTELALDYAKTYLQKPVQAQTKRRASRRKKVGLISPMFHSGPLYYLTSSAFNDLSRSHDLILFNRGRKTDWATERFRAIATKEIPCQYNSWQTLAEVLRDEKLDLLFDLGGWTDTEALKAVSTRPATKQYKWVGGQALTTGLSCFDGFISDEWHTPKPAQGLYTEPLLILPSGYATYTPPDYMPLKTKTDRGAVGIIGNPLKVTQEVFSRLDEKRKHGFFWPREIRLIDRRYAHPKVRERVEKLLDNFKGKVTWLAVDSHRQFLEEVSRLEAVLDTSPHSAGLTAREALHLGVKLIPAQRERMLFSSRHGIAALESQKAAVSSRLTLALLFD